MELAHERSLDQLLPLVTQRLAEHEDVALARLWLIDPGDQCDGCPNAAACSDRSRCLHLVASTLPLARRRDRLRQSIERRFSPHPDRGVQGGRRGRRRSAGRGDRSRARSQDPATGVGARRADRRLRRVAARLPGRASRCAGRVRSRADHRRGGRRAAHRGQSHRGRHRHGARRRRGHRDAPADPDRERSPAPPGQPERRAERGRRGADRRERADARGAPPDRRRGSHRRRRPDPGRVGHREGAGRARHPSSEPAGRADPSSSSTAPRSHASWRRRSSSATCAARSPGRRAIGSVASKRRRAARFSSTRWASCRRELQAKLLRVLQEGTYERVGDVRTRRTDVRIVAATNRNLLVEVDAGRFRQDLYYRLAIFPVSLPPLRERQDDLPALVDHLLARICRRLNRPPLSLTGEQLRELGASPLARQRARAGQLAGAGDHLGELRRRAELRTRPGGSGRRARRRSRRDGRWPSRRSRVRSSRRAHRTRRRSFRISRCDGSSATT